MPRCVAPSWHDMIQIRLRELETEPGMLDVKVPDDLWATSTLPEGVLERWLVSDGADVRAGDPVATVRIEKALHEIMAPAQGRLTIFASENAVIEPGTLLARLDPETRSTPSAPEGGFADGR
jgi:pyruvate/2-oxoglutarate dehydrogenase complex dihydrolipoamide acyltransferase (E2) component